MKALVFKGNGFLDCTQSDSLVRLHFDTKKIHLLSAYVCACHAAGPPVASPSANLSDAQSAFQLVNAPSCSLLKIQ